MKKNLAFLFIAATLFVFNSCQTGNSWHPLFNGENLDNWDKYIGSPLKGAEDLAKTATPENVFTVVEKDGEKLIRISGVVNGSLATRDTFANYHLQLVFKWGNAVYSRQNSGLLYHSFGEFGTALDTWMECIECQLMHEKLGDTYLMNDTYCETAVNKTDDGFIFNKNGEIKKFGKAHNGQSIQKAVDAENNLREWNTVDLYTVGQTTVYIINGKTVMVNNKTSKWENGKAVPLTSGKIQLQSEGAELFIKSIKIKNIDKIPDEVL
jgi:hypothetical protein